ncbi:MAG: Hsp20/alpha crystallin family protein [Candidatus Nezhaarchaeota archaeon]|nr:Hsp20/alpha crystallin family protein [Candidatus Nezhaarchaeota archaeon]MCX8141754.1 Hsp20/alpha crystallin family protein [Candidatus Nezhaarchaeota archaeon]MDW8050468.1 archaeal heat shock protein Hsp20 [Nitrososphaerota archaeon]
MWWRPRRFSRIFDEIERTFEEIDDMIDRMFQTFSRASKEAGRVTIEGPYYYGFSITIGPDGKPVIQEFGNVRPSRWGVERSDVRRPYVETIIDDKAGELKVIAELPGVDKDSIKVSSTDVSVTIKAEHGDRKYYADVKLPAKVDPSSAKASYRNGVLEVTFKLKERVEEKGYEIKVD